MARDHGERIGRSVGCRKCGKKERNDQASWGLDFAGSASEIWPQK